jgi:hypothetical protein
MERRYQDGQDECPGEGRKERQKQEVGNIESDQRRHQQRKLTDKSKTLPGWRHRYRRILSYHRDRRVQENRCGAIHSLIHAGGGMDRQTLWDSAMFASFKCETPSAMILMDAVTSSLNRP